MAYRRFKPSIAASESEAQTVANVASVAGGHPYMPFCQLLQLPRLKP
jgi:hypothetical protein